MDLARPFQHEAEDPRACLSVRDLEVESAAIGVETRLPHPRDRQRAQLARCPSQPVTYSHTHKGKLDCGIVRTCTERQIREARPKNYSSLRTAADSHGQYLERPLSATHLYQVVVRVWL